MLTKYLCYDTYNDFTAYNCNWINKCVAFSI